MKMLACFEADGRISNLIFEPFPQGLIEHHESEGILHVLVDTDLPGHEIAIKHYVKDGDVLERPVFDVPDTINIAADGQDEAAIVGLPDPCMVKIDGEDATVTGGSLVITADMPAEYTIELIQWPYIEKTVKVIAHAPEA